MPKNYTTEQYLAYAKYILEGDASAADFDEIENEEISPQFKKLIAGAAISGTGAIACLAYLHHKYGIKDLHGLSKCFKALFRYIRRGPIGKILATIGSAISAALLWANKLVKPISDKVGKVVGGTVGSAINKPISQSRKFLFGTKASPYSYGSCVCLTVAACAIGAVLYKVYKVIKSKVTEGETKAAYYARIQEGVNMAVIESKAMFSDLTQLVEAGPSFGRVAGHYIAKSVPGLQKIMGYTDAEIAALAAPLNKADAFIKSMQGKIMEMWNWVVKTFKANMAFGIMVSICAACVCCWVGLRKHMSNNPEFNAEPTSEGVIVKKAKKAVSSGKKLVAKPKKAVKSVKAKSNIKAAAKKMKSKKK